MTQTAYRYLQPGVAFPSLGITNPQVHAGTIISGDQFIYNSAQHKHIADSTKDLLTNGFHAVEMEGAAVAQVCDELNLPFIVLRSISDKANQEAPVNFQDFLDQVAGMYSLGILTEYFQDKTSS
jgi:adenosylhomocysteine nucleosidase